MRFNPCNFSIILPAKLRDRRQYNEDNTEGISINKFADKSSETKFGASEVQAGADNVGNEQSVKHRYFRHCHFSSGRAWAFDADEDSEEFDTKLFDRYNIPARPLEEELLRELDGRGEAARLPRWSGISESEPVLDVFCAGVAGYVFRGLGDVLGGNRVSPMYDGEWMCRELLCRRFSASSRTRSMINSDGSLMFPLRTINERRVSDMTCHP